ncbi:hypothetical protein MMPV_007516 [Pyropia vietnamensis]
MLSMPADSSSSDSSDGEAMSSLEMLIHCNSTVDAFLATLPTVGVPTTVDGLDGGGDVGAADATTPLGSLEGTVRCGGASAAAGEGMGGGHQAGSVAGSYGRASQSRGTPSGPSLPPDVYRLLASMDTQLTSLHGAVAEMRAELLASLARLASGGVVPPPAPVYFPNMDGSIPGADAGIPAPYYYPHVPQAGMFAVAPPGAVLHAYPPGPPPAPVCVPQPSSAVQPGVPTRASTATEEVNPAVEMGHPSLDPLVRSRSPPVAAAADDPSRKRPSPPHPPMLYFSPANGSAYGPSAARWAPSSAAGGAPADPVGRGGSSHPAGHPVAPRSPGVSPGATAVPVANGGAAAAAAATERGRSSIAEPVLKSRRLIDPTGCAPFIWAPTSHPRHDAPPPEQVAQAFQPPAAPPDGMGQAHWGPFSMGGGARFPMEMMAHAGALNMSGVPHPIYTHQSTWYYRAAPALTAASAVPAAASYANHRWEPAVVAGAAAPAAAGPSPSPLPTGPLTAAAGGEHPPPLGELPLRETPAMPHLRTPNAALDVAPLDGTTPSSATGGGSQSTGKMPTNPLTSIDGIEPASHSAGPSEAAASASRSAAAGTAAGDPQQELPQAQSPLPFKGVGGAGGTWGANGNQRTLVGAKRRSRLEGSAEEAEL